MHEHLDPVKDPTSYTVITYAWVLLLSGLGGIVSFVRKVNNGRSHRWSIVEFLGEVSGSALSGLITFYLCEAGHITPLFTAAMVGISGHMGSRALYQLEMVLRKKFPMLGDDQKNE